MRRRWPLLALTAAVTLGHLWLADDVIPARLGDGAASTLPRRIDVAFVQELAQSAPPVAAPAAARPPPKPRPRATPAVAQGASAPAPAASAVEPPPLVVAQAPEPVVETPPSAAPAETPPSAASADAASAPPVSAAAAAASAPTPSFDWPPSTRISYRFTGNYRGEVSGAASVEWLRQGMRYQVQMEVLVGGSFAPLLRRRVSSEGEITPQGLQPRRYDEETKALVGAARRNNIQMDASTVRLANGSEVPRPAGLQDSASQFVHLTWLFTTQPQLLQTGRSVELPLALPRRVEPWVYDVLGTETLQTPVGEVATVHVKPRRPPKAGDTLTAEIWVAPSLQYLPVRIVIRQDAETYIDMLMERLPQQAAQRE